MAMTEDEQKLVTALRALRDEQRAKGDKALRCADTLEETARLIESPRTEISPMPLTHWSKDPLVPYQRCTCSTCLSAVSNGSV